MHASQLIPHPSTPCALVRALRVQVTVSAAALELHYRLEGDLDGLVIPAPRGSARADRLWQHTCFEAFVTRAGAAGYVELNFSPSTEWVIYRFSGYRAGMTEVDPARPPHIGVGRDGASLSLQAAVDWSVLGEPRGGDALRLALSAVVEQAGGRLSYWALAHPAGRPDFHHAEGFVFELDAPR
jgi:hypothetical protein